VLRFVLLLLVRSTSTSIVFEFGLFAARDKESQKLCEAINHAATQYSNSGSECSGEISLGCSIPKVFFGAKPSMNSLISLAQMCVKMNFRIEKALAVMAMRSFQADARLAMLGAVNEASIDLSFGEAIELLDLQKIKGYMETVPTMMKMAFMQAKQPALVIANLIKAFSPGMMLKLPTEVREFLKLFKANCERIDDVSLVFDGGAALVLQQSEIFENCVLPVVP